MPQGPRKGPFNARGANVPQLVMGTRLSAYRFSLQGYTLTGSGSVEPNCTVHLFQASDDVEVGITTSDVNGLYIFYPSGNSPTYYAVAFSTDGQRKGCTLPTLVAI